MSEPVQILIKQLDAELPLPKKAYRGDAAFDICSTMDCVLAPGERRAIPTGIAIALPEGYAALVLPRSGLAARNGITVVNAPGLIDSNYRGEIASILLNTDTSVPFEIHRGDRISQLMIIKLPAVDFNVVDVLPESDRGAGGFGSSGVRVTLT